MSYTATHTNNSIDTVLNTPPEALREAMERGCTNAGIPQLVRKGGVPEHFSPENTAAALLTGFQHDAAQHPTATRTR